MSKARLMQRLAAAFVIAPALVLADAPTTAPAVGARSIDVSVTVDAPRAAVWEAWTTSAGVTAFFAPAARVELRYGGPYEIYFVPEAARGQRGSEGCTVLGFLPEEMLSFTWNAPPAFETLRGQRTFVIVRLEEAGEGKTHVRLVQGGWGEGEKWDELFGYFEKAWPYVLGNLKKRFESGPTEWPAQLKEAAAGITHPALKQYVYYIHPARAEFFTSPTEEESRIVGEHAKYVRELEARNVLIFAGPSFDPPVYPDSDPKMQKLELPAPGIVVFEAESPEAAKAIMEGDPAVAAGVFKARLNTFHLAFRRR